MSTVFPDRSIVYEEKRDGRRKKKNVCVRVHVYVRVYMTEGGKRTYMCARVCACVRTGCRRERWTRVALAEREEANRLHYANAVQLQLTVAKNRCRYRGMLSRNPEGDFYTLVPLARPLFLALVRVLSISLDALRLFQNSGYIPAVE